MRRLTNNLASEPFLNRRVPFAVAGVLGLLALGATAGNVFLFVVRGGEYRQHRAARAAQQQRVKELDQELREQKRLLEGREVGEYIAGARFAQTILDQKRFSWNRFLDRLEGVKPFGVLFTDISPRWTTGRALEIRLRGMANDRQEVLKLEQALLASPEFESPQLETEERDQGGVLTRFSFVVRYNDAPGGKP